MVNNPLEDIQISAYVKLLRTADALLGRVSRGLTPDGLTASQFSTLKVLRLRGPLAQRDIAKYLVKSGGNVTVVVDNLERQGLVVRVRDTEDRRLIFVNLTSAGQELFDRIYPAHLERIRSVVDALSDDELRQLKTLLSKLHTTDEPLCMPDSEAAPDAVSV